MAGYDAGVKMSSRQRDGAVARQLGHRRAPGRGGVSAPTGAGAAAAESCCFIYALPGATALRPRARAVPARIAGGS